jgi:hypothetical protein
VQLPARVVKTQGSFPDKLGQQIGKKPHRGPRISSDRQALSAGHLLVKRGTTPPARR